MTPPDANSGTDSEAGASAELFDFVHQYLEDEANASVGTLDDYLRRFPGLEEEVALEFARLAGRDASDGSPGAMVPDERRVGPYRLLGLIGCGGQAAVYAAADTRVDRKVALKVFHPAFASLSGEQLKRFHREVEVVSRLNHPGICPVFEADTDAGVPFLAMPLITGATLKDILAAESETAGETQRDGSRDRARIHRAVSIIEQVARALHAAHEAGILHRDVKPGNIMVGADDRPIILDFGLARESDASDAGTTATGALVGTPAYLAPEIVTSGIRSSSVQSDVYALGVTLYEWIASSLPFSAPTRAGLLAAIVRGEAATLRSIEPHVGRDLDVAVATAMEPDCNRRYQSAQAFADELARIREGRPILARPVSAWRRLVRWSRRRPALAAAAFCTLVGFATSIFFWHRAEVAVDAYEIVAGATEVARLRAEADRLWPLDPQLAPAMRDWSRRAREIATRLPAIDGMLDRLRRSGTRRTGSHSDEFAAASHPVASAAVPFVPSPESDTWEFPDVSLQFQHDVLTEYSRGLHQFADGDRGLIAQVDGRATFLEMVAARTIERHRDAWREAIASIGDVARFPHYRGIKLEPIAGLIPIGPDPASQLYEFVDLGTTALELRDDPVPVRSADGRLRVTWMTGVVFVLLPGGATKVGSVPSKSPNAGSTDQLDDDGEPHERPVRDVVLEPFLMSKYEMTQGQWSRVTGQNPSFFQDQPKTMPDVDLRRMPVEFVSWEESDLWARRLGWVLPTEAQWEYAARGLTKTAWSTGRTRDSLIGFANVAGAEFNTASGSSRVLHEPWNDGFERPWPVGTGRANPFGLHDVHGNVWEWCRDGFSDYAGSSFRDGDGFKSGGQTLGPVYRGGSWLRDAYWARCSARLYNRSDYRRNEVGLRPARTIPIRNE